MSSTEQTIPFATMKAVNDGGPAFPQNDLSAYGLGPAMRGDRHEVEGMSLRDWFAGMAFMGMSIGEMPLKQVAEEAYFLADFMIAERSKATTPARSI